VSLQAALEAADFAISAVVGSPFQGSGNYNMWKPSMALLIDISQQRPK